MAKNAVFVLVSIIVLVLIYSTLQMTVPRANIYPPIEVEIEKGMSFTEAVNLLKKQGLIQDENPFIALGRVTGLHRRLTPGYYMFFGKVSPWDVFKSLRYGLIITWEITVVEGNTLSDIRENMAEKGVMSGEKFDGLTSDHAFLAGLGIDAPSLEGYLYPDTYRIPKGAKPEEVLEMMVKRLREVYNADLMERTHELGLDELRVLTLASIIEKEAVIDRERPIISAVYHNRLRKGMPLQADPTAIYGIKPQSAGITLSDIKRKSEYNTYYIKGLPPGPIASPGIKSIRAALHPANVPYLFFVSNNDGTHTFSVTLEEHLEAVEAYKSLKNTPKVES
jgi:UPF0755 protein